MTAIASQITRAVSVARMIPLLVAMSICLSPEILLAQSSKAPPSLEGTQPPDAVSKGDLDYTADSSRQKMIPLYIGIEYQERLPYLPPEATFKGDYKRVTKISVNKDTNTLRFQAIQEGVATL